MHSSEKRIATSVLVIGTGGSGLRAAIELAERGVGVLAVGKRHPDLDLALQVNLVWSGPGSVEREPIPPIPVEIAALMREVSTSGKLVD